MKLKTKEWNWAEGAEQAKSKMKSIYWWNGWLALPALLRKRNGAQPKQPKAARQAERMESNQLLRLAAGPHNWWMEREIRAQQAPPAPPLKRRSPSLCCSPFFFSLSAPLFFSFPFEKRRRESWLREEEMEPHPTRHTPTHFSFGAQPKKKRESWLG